MGDPQASVAGRAGPRRSRLLIVVGALAAVLSPAVTGRDSFPLSTYPMYATARGAEVTLATVVGVTARGRFVRLSLPVIARTDDPLVAESAVADAIRADQAIELCREVARRARRDLVEIQVVTERHDVDARAAGRDSLQERIVRARCEGRDSG